MSGYSCFGGWVVGVVIGFAVRQKTDAVVAELAAECRALDEHDHDECLDLQKPYMRLVGRPEEDEL